MPFGLIVGAIRMLSLVAVAVVATIDAAIVCIRTEPAGGRLAGARAEWLHRWSRVALFVMGLRREQRGFAPVSGIVVANYTSLIDAILLAAARPCVFVAGIEVHRMPIIGILARLAGTIFIDHSVRHDLARVNFMIQRTVQRRLLVVVFPQCYNKGRCSSQAFSTPLFEPAAKLGCSLTAARISYVDRLQGYAPAALLSGSGRSFTPIGRFITQLEINAMVAFEAPAFRRGDRKSLARELQAATNDL
jgi:1-acyl-sn-glycerol-3-phosphate acyltransferase